MSLKLLLVLPFALLSSCSEFTTPPPKPEVKKVEPKPIAPPVAKAKPKPKPKKKSVISTQYGIASWYSVKTNFGTKTASGRPFSNNAYTAAHKTLPMGTKVRVTNLSNGRSELLTITDRGPYIKGRIIDVSIGSGKRLGFYSKGITRVKVEVLKRGNWKYRHPS